MLTVVPDPSDRDQTDQTRSGFSLIDEIVREGARQMPAQALQAEVDAYVARFADQRAEQGHRLVVRNGCHQPRQVLTSAEAMDVRAPRVNDKCIDHDTVERRRFSSAILPPWRRKTPKPAEVLPLLYLHGLSSRDFVLALGQFLGSGAGLSASVKAFDAAYGVKFGKAVSRVTDEINELLAFYDFPAEHWIRLRTTNPIESTCDTARHRTKVTKGPGSRTAGLAMAFKPIEFAQARRCAVNPPHLVALVHAGARFERGILLERDEVTAA